MLPYRDAGQECPKFRKLPVRDSYVFNVYFLNGRGGTVCCYLLLICVMHMVFFLICGVTSKASRLIFCDHEECATMHDNLTQATWRTSDGSAWWLRSQKYSEPTPDYTANCYMDLYGAPPSENSVTLPDPLYSEGMASISRPIIQCSHWGLNQDVGK